jgi:hypothetical protein
MISNDEPVYLDALGHYDLARQLGHRVLKCPPPYVIGICGSWGSGKTSFLKMLWAYLGGPFELPGRKYASLRDDERKKWFTEARRDYDQLLNKRRLEPIWFNPWQHQFETSPLVALLNEIRKHFTMPRKAFNEAGKLIDVATHATLNALADLGKELKIPIPGARGIMERGREYETEHFSTGLASQRFRDFFEEAIRSVTGKNGLLVIFIDDLDRCEGDVAYRLLEALKLYVNADNCVYILGLDQNHLERSIAKALSGEAETWRHRPLARDYLSKIFQNLYHLPVPRHTSRYVDDSLDADDAEFKTQLTQLFGLTKADWKLLVEALDDNLPHNPRKIKSFVASWKLYIDSLTPPEGRGEKLDWRLTVILHYLAQFEEPLFRKVEEAPAFYSDHIIRFCRDGFSPHPLFEGLELPYSTPRSGSEADEKGGLGSPTSSATEGAVVATAKQDERQLQAQPRIFWISRLVNAFSRETRFKLDDEIVHRHLLRAGGKTSEPPPLPQVPEEGVP